MNNFKFSKSYMILTLIIILVLMTPATQVKAWGGTFANAIANQDSADPSIVFKDGFYYMTRTSTPIEIYKSRTLDYRDAEKKTIYTPKTGEPSNIWAPELQYLDGKWVIYFAGIISGGTDSSRRMYTLEADTDDPMGTWSLKGKIYDSTTDKWAIDGAAFEIGSQKYFVWSGWEGDVNIRQNLYIASMSNLNTISGARVEIARPAYSWETVGSPDVLEGPQPLIKNGKVYIIYSCSGSWTPDYKLGMLSMDITKNPLTASNWTKHPSPVFQRNDVNGVYGPGHNTFTVSPDGTEDWLIYHATPNASDGWNNRWARAQKFTWNSDGTPNFGTPQALATPLEVPSGTGKFEAEHQTVNNAQIIADATASDNTKVGNINAADSWVEWKNVKVPSDGVYRLQVRYANNSDTDATDNIFINGMDSDKITLPKTGSSWGTVSRDISLIAGFNNIRLSKGIGTADIDYIDITRFEAEYAGLNQAQIDESGEASNGKKAGGLDSPDSWIEFRNIQVPDDGEYIMRIRYANGLSDGSDSTHNILVNGTAAGAVIYPNKGQGNWSSVTMPVSLNAGKNTIRFMKGSNYADIDYIEIYVTGSGDENPAILEDSVRFFGDFDIVPNDLPLGEYIETDANKGDHGDFSNLRGTVVNNPVPEFGKSFKIDYHGDRVYTNMGDKKLGIPPTSRFAIELIFTPNSWNSGGLYIGQGTVDLSWKNEIITLKSSHNISTGVPHSALMVYKGLNESNQWMYDIFVDNKKIDTGASAKDITVFNYAHFMVRKEPGTVSPDILVDRIKIYTPSTIQLQGLKKLEKNTNISTTGGELVCEFINPPNADTVLTSNFKILDKNNNIVPGAISQVQVDTTNSKRVIVHLNETTALFGNSTYKIIADGITDIYGNQLNDGMEFSSLDFTTGVYSISAVRFYNSNGVELKSLPTASGDITCKVTVKNCETSSSLDCSLILALFETDGNGVKKLNAIDTDSSLLTATQEKEYEATVSFSCAEGENLSKYILKATLWDGIENNQVYPLINSVTMNTGGIQSANYSVTPVMYAQEYIKAMNEP